MDIDKIKQIVQILEEKKFKNIEAFDLKNKSNLIKFIIVATSSNEKTCRLLSYEIEEILKGLSYEVKREGDFPGDWIVLDLGDILIELLIEDVRKYYNLEKLWGDYNNRVPEIKNKKRKKK